MAGEGINRMMNWSTKKNFWTATVVSLVVVGVGMLALFAWNPDKDEPQAVSVTSFAECQAQGYPILESYPAQCKTPDGQTFTEDIGNEIELADIIHISTPRPNTSISSPLTVEGEARGSWFFEAEFSVRLLDAEDVEIATGIATAQDDWMTEEFVPFSATLTFDPDTGIDGTLVLEKANPSGLPQNADALHVPVRFDP